MATANSRNYVNLQQTAPQLDSLEDARRLMQQLLDAAHELNARIYFLQEQLAVVATAAGAPVAQLEDY